MSRPLFIRILLSLLLVLSQQMASLHALSHLGSVMTGTVQAVDDEDAGDLSRAVAQDKSCHHCLAFAQLVGPLGLTPRAFAPPDLVASASPPAPGQARACGAVCPFEPRGPPHA
ncbi:MAG: hypothetical protein ACLGI6_16505 [Gammaproteobacteria bacterium]